MDSSNKEMDTQEQKIKKLADDIDPTQEIAPDSLAEATTVPLDDSELGPNATEADVKKNN